MGEGQTPSTYPQRKIGALMPDISWAPPHLVDKIDGGGAFDMTGASQGVSPLLICIIYNQ